MTSVPSFENAYVRVDHLVLEGAVTAPRGSREGGIVRFVEVIPPVGPAIVLTVAPPTGGRPSWAPGVLPRAVRVEVKQAPPRPSPLLEPGATLPPDAHEEARGEGIRIARATYFPYRFDLGTGRLASVATFLSDGVVEVTSRGVRRQMGVQAGDAFWFEAGTRLTNVDDFPLDVVLVQLSGR